MRGVIPLQDVVFVLLFSTRFSDQQLTLLHIKWSYMNALALHTATASATAPGTGSITPLILMTIKIKATYTDEQGARAGW